MPYIEISRVHLATLKRNQQYILGTMTVRTPSLQPDVSDRLQAWVEMSNNAFAKELVVKTIVERAATEPEFMNFLASTCDGDTSRKSHANGRPNS